MRRKCPITLAALVSVGAVVLAAVAAPAAWASTDPSHGPVSTPVSFVMGPDQCPSISVTISGSTVYRTVTNSRTDSSGVTHMEISQLATGQATDNLGGTYHFSYHNHSSVDTSPAGFPVQVRQNDHFILEGTGSASGLHVGFLILLTFTDPTSPPTITPINERGLPNCDPI